MVDELFDASGIVDMEEAEMEITQILFGRCLNSSLKWEYVLRDIAEVDKFEVRVLLSYFVVGPHICFTA